MKIRNFVVDSGKLTKDEQSLVEGVSRSKRKWTGPDGDLRLLTVVMAESLKPVGCSFLRVAIEDGVITSESKSKAMRAFLLFKEGNSDIEKLSSPEVRHQLDGWPADWMQQLAVACDIPITDIPSVTVGGPLAVSTQLDISIPQVLAHYRQK